MKTEDEKPKVEAVEKGSIKPFFCDMWRTMKIPCATQCDGCKQDQGETDQYYKDAHEKCLSFSDKYPCDGNGCEEAVKAGYCLCWEQMEKEEAAAPVEAKTPDRDIDVTQAYMDRIVNTLIDKWGLSMLQARDIGRDFLYTYILPIYELGGQYKLKVSPTEEPKSESQEDSEEKRKMVTEIIQMWHDWVEDDSFETIEKRVLRKFTITRKA